MPKEYLNKQRVGYQDAGSGAASVKINFALGRSFDVPKEAKQLTESDKGFLDSFFYYSLTKQWNSTTSMRTVYRAELENMAGCASTCQCYVQQEYETGLKILFFENSAVFFSRDEDRSLSVSRTVFRGLMEYYIDLFQKKYWCSQKEKERWADLLANLEAFALCEEVEQEALEEESMLEAEEAPAAEMREFDREDFSKRMGHVYFADEALHVFVNKQLNRLLFQPVVPYDMRMLKVLDCKWDSSRSHERPVSDLAPLALCENLKSLFLPDCKAGDYSPLSGLKRLEKLGLSGGGQACLAFLCELDGSPSPAAHSLKVLDLGGCHATDFTPLRHCTGLVSLVLNSTAIKDLSVLEGMKQLRRLSIDNCPKLSHLEALETLPALQSLTICREAVKEYSLSEKMPGLKECILTSAVTL